MIAEREPLAPPAPPRRAVAAFTLVACPAVWFGAPYLLAALLALAGRRDGGFVASLPELLAIGSFLYAPLLPAVMAFTYVALRRRLLAWSIWGPGAAAFAVAAVLAYGHFSLSTGNPRPEVVELVARASAAGGLVYGLLIRAGAGLLLGGAGGAGPGWRAGPAVRVNG